MGKTSAIFLGGAAIMLFVCNAVAHMGPLLNELTMLLIGVLVIGPDSQLSGTVISDLVKENGLGPPDVGTVAGLIQFMGSFGSIFQSGATAYITQNYGWSTLFMSFVTCALTSSAILTSKGILNRK